MNQFRTYKFDPRILMCSIESEKSTPESVSYYNDLFSSFLKAFSEYDAFATVTPFGIHFRIAIDSEEDMMTLPLRFNNWIQSDYQYRADADTFVDIEVPTLTDFSITPTSLLDPEGFKKRVQAALESNKNNNE